MSGVGTPGLNDNREQVGQKLTDEEVVNDTDESGKEIKTQRK